ncbi:DnaB Replicative DNA helicase [uncultured Caudovirales phage]|uniref:DnaB Replicative DNA helicase n=1 Tax=uncultured Caudovirales phage TaxID=2100421 RepID=A0A6J5PYB2_9CAUD|nr:DnaB Replicative DNA helicase [uncultured Caudovirales phage]CAB4185619.1 DnaB Replicative DNA helicase [uncultured Caudovirales phage]CAB4193209.1 DnaB Replicative DNA helicase [uncultured Caudovirales phage]CAB4216184.1 DnaB Replicative DNA helicase [uncultured Caudovirales phage]CAB5230810.1 DnaB Replicative DNA helicase [uncultured Caudovirales phage]
MDISAIVLNKLLVEKNLDVWAKLKLAFLDPAYSSVYSTITRHYTKYSTIPSFDELEAVSREGPAQKILATLKLTDEADITAEVALDALIDQYTQNETIKLLDKFIDKLPIYDTAEIKDNLASIVLTLDEKTLSTEGVYSMSDIMVFIRPDDLARSRIHLGLNNTFDAVLGGAARQELILIGGKRGSGKSITSSNIMISQYESGNTSVYFTIEMIAHETLTRNISILADVNHQRLKNGSLTDAELLKVVKARAEMFVDAGELVSEFIKDRDQFKFEETVVKECALKPDNQMIIIDDRALTLSSIDLHLGKVKSRFGDKFTVAVIDYLNQIVVEGASQFDWQPQVIISKKLKELARKYDIVIVSPYQIDATGEARFAKGILDAADIALVMEAHDKEASAISFETTKIRGAKEMHFTSAMDWDTLRISPIPIEKPASKEKVKKVSKHHANAEPAGDLPWDT